MLFRGERRLQRVGQATHYLDNALHDAESARRPIQVTRTGTLVDQLILTLNKKVVARSPFPTE